MIIDPARGRGLVHFVEGRPVHAAFRDQVGEKALRSMLRFTAGKFRLKPESPEEEPTTIERGVSELLAAG